MMGWRGQQNRDEELRREEQREWEKLPLHTRLVATGSFWAFVAFVALMVSSVFWLGSH